MKIHAKKKATRAAWKRLAISGMMPNARTGMWEKRSLAPDNSMKRDFSPQEGKR